MQASKNKGNKRISTTLAKLEQMTISEGEPYATKPRDILPKSGLKQPKKALFLESLKSFDNSEVGRSDSRQQRIAQHNKMKKEAKKKKELERQKAEEIKRQKDRRDAELLNETAELLDKMIVYTKDCPQGRYLITYEKSIASRKEHIKQAIDNYCRESKFAKKQDRRARSKNKSIVTVDGLCYTHMNVIITSMESLPINKAYNNFKYKQVIEWIINYHETPDIGTSFGRSIRSFGSDVVYVFTRLLWTYMFLSTGSPFFFKMFFNRSNDIYDITDRMDIAEFNAKLLNLLVDTMERINRSINLIVDFCSDCIDTFYIDEHNNRMYICFDCNHSFVLPILNTDPQKIELLKSLIEKIAFFIVQITLISAFIENSFSKMSRNYEERMQSENGSKKEFGSESKKEFGSESENESESESENESESESENESEIESENESAKCTKKHPPFSDPKSKKSLYYDTRGVDFNELNNKILEYFDAINNFISDNEQLNELHIEILQNELEHVKELEKISSKHKVSGATPSLMTKEAEAQEINTQQAASKDNVTDQHSMSTV